MKSLLKLSALAFLVAVGAFVFTAARPHTAVAQDDNQQVSTEEQAPAEENNDQEEAAPTSYTYTAQPGDSYTKMARKAVQTYGWEKQVNLSRRLTKVKRRRIGHHPPVRCRSCRKESSGPERITVGTLGALCSIRRLQHQQRRPGLIKQVDRLSRASATCGGPILFHKNVGFS